MTGGIEETASWAVRKLLRASRQGTLATTDAGQPHVSLVTPACAPDLSLLILTSELSPHTRHLRADPRCALMVAGPPAETNPQTAPRVGVTGIARPEPDPALKARWLAVHPYAELYAGFGDFSLWRITLEGGQFVGGFARAARLSATDLAPDAEAVARIAASEAGIVAHCNQDHADTMALIAGGGEGEGWRMVAADVDGCDIASGERVVRVAWSSPVSDAGGVRTELVRLARAARANFPPAPS